MAITEKRKTIRSLRSFVKDTLWYFPSKAVPAVVGVLGVAVYTRLLLPEEYGAYVLTITTISVTSLLFFGWLNHSALRFLEIARSENNIHKYFSTLLATLLTLLGLALFAWYMLSPFLQSWIGVSPSLLRIGGGVLVFQAGFTLLQNILRAERKVVVYSLFASLESLGRLFIAFLLLYVLSFGPEGILLGHLVGAGTLVVVGYVWLSQEYNLSLARYFDRGLVIQFFSYGFPLVLFSAGELFLSVADRYILGFFLDQESVGIYSAGYQVASTGISFFFLPIILAGFPILIQAYHSGAETEVKAVFDNYIGAFFVVVTPITAIFMALSEEIAKMILGAKFTAAEEVIPWVAVGVFFLGLSWCVNKYVLLKNRSSLLIYPVGIATFVNILVNILLIPALGILGAAVATTLAYFLYFLVTLFIGRQWHRWSFPWKTIWKTLLASSGTALALRYVPIENVATLYNFLFQVLLGLFLYLVLLMLFREPILSQGIIFLKKRRRFL